MSPRTAVLTITTMVAFAANTLLCRMALVDGLIDAASFMAVRTMTGALTLLLIVLPRWRLNGFSRCDARPAYVLVLYMITFSFAYLSVGAGTGAVIFFGVVQLTMSAVALRSGERFSPAVWLGFGLAISGLLYLVSPGITAPDPFGACLMAAAGVAWAAYSLLGKSASEPVEATAYNFLIATPLVIAAALPFAREWHWTAYGLALATASGALASGLGYILWYTALQGLTAGRAAAVQLSVPVLAAFGGVVLLSEPLTLRMLVSGAATLGGITIVLGLRGKRAMPASDAAR